MSQTHAAPDVVVVGAGAGGASAALRLVELGLDVLVLERGPEVTPPASQDAQSLLDWIAPPGESNVWVDDPHVAYIAEGNHVGGSTNVFASNMLRFHADDFRRKTLLGDLAGANLADWPLSYDELAPHYDALEHEMGIAGGDLHENPFEPRRTAPLPQPPVPLDAAGRVFRDAALRLGWHPYPIPTVIGAGAGRKACAPCGRCSGHVCTFGARWSARDFVVLGQQRGKLVLRSRAQVTRLLADVTGDRLRGVEWADQEGVLHAVEARAVILAANAVQTPRILLASADARHPHGLCNDSGQVGRNLMTHAHAPIWIAGYLPDGPRTTATPGSTIAIQDHYDNPIGLGATIEPRALGSLQGWRNITVHDPARPRDANAQGEYERRFDTNVLIVNMVEDVPVEANRVTLSAERKDRLGLPLAEVRHAAHPIDLEIGAYVAKQAERLLDEAGAQGRFAVDWGPGRLHVFGTARMGADPASSVVDGFGRAHRVANLYVADASLFVTSAGVNPALTICALARRAAEHLADACSRREL